MKKLLTCLGVWFVMAIVIEIVDVLLGIDHFNTGFAAYFIHTVVYLIMGGIIFKLPDWLWGK